MKTYVEILGYDGRFKDIDDAIQTAEDKGMEAVEVFVYDNQTSEIVDSQDCERDDTEEEFVYYTWGIFGYVCYDGSDRVESSDILGEGISSKEEAIEAAEKLREKLSRYDYVTVEKYSQTLSENISDVSECERIYPEQEEHHE